MDGALQIAERFRVAAVQMVSSTQLEENLAQAAQGIADAVQIGAHLVVLPEYFCIMGRAETDKLALRESPGQGPIQDFLRAQARQYGIWLVGGTLPLETGEPDHIYNSTLVFGPDGSQLARYDKIHLFGFRNGDEAFDESRTILAGKTPQSFDAPCGRVGLSICYDLRFPELYRALAPATLIVVPSAFTFTTGSAHWETLLRARAIENQCYVLAAAQGGRHENGRRTWGHSMLVDPWGSVIECLPEGAGVVAGDIVRERLAEVRASLPALQHRVL